MTDCDQARHSAGQGAQCSSSLCGPSPRSEETEVDRSFFSWISRTGGSKAVLWYRVGGLPRPPPVGGGRVSVSSPRVTSEATTPATTVRESPVSSSSSPRVSPLELAKLASTRRSRRATDEP